MPTKAKCENILPTQLRCSFSFGSASVRRAWLCARSTFGASLMASQRLRFASPLDFLASIFASTAADLYVLSNYMHLVLRTRVVMGCPVER